MVWLQDEQLVTLKDSDTVEKDINSQQHEEDMKMKYFPLSNNISIRKKKNKNKLNRVDTLVDHEALLLRSETFMSYLEERAIEKASVLKKSSDDEKFSFVIGTMIHPV